MAAREPLNAYRVAPTAENEAQLVAAGFDMIEGDHGTYLEVYGTAKQAAGCQKRGPCAQAGRQGARERGQAADVPVGSDAHVQRLAPLRQGADRHQGAVPRAL